MNEPQQTHEMPPAVGLGSSDLFGAAKNAIEAWDVLTDTTRPTAFANMKSAMEKLRDAAEEHEADEIGRCVDAMTPEQVEAYLVRMGMDVAVVRDNGQRLRQKIESRFKLTDQAISEAAAREVLSLPSPNVSGQPRAEDGR